MARREEWKARVGGKISEVRNSFAYIVELEWPGEVKRKERKGKERKELKRKENNRRRVAFCNHCLRGRAKVMRCFTDPRRRTLLTVYSGKA